MDNNCSNFEGAGRMFLRRKAHIVRRNQEAQGGYFGAQGAYIVRIKLGGKDHERRIWIVRRMITNLM